MTGWLLIDIIEVAPSPCPPPALPPPPTATDADGCMHGNYAIIASFVSSAFAFAFLPSFTESFQEEQFHRNKCGLPRLPRRRLEEVLVGVLAEGSR